MSLSNPRYLTVGVTLAGKLPHAVDRVVVVRSQDELRSVLKRKRFSHQLGGSGRIPGETNGELVGIGVEEIEHPPSGVIHDLRREEGGLTLGVRVPQHGSTQEVRVLSHLGLRIQPAARVVQVGQAELVEPPELAATQLGEGVRAVRSGPRRCQARLRKRSPACALARSSGPMSHRPILAPQPVESHRSSRERSDCRSHEMRAASEASGESTGLTI